MGKNNRVVDVLGKVQQKADWHRAELTPNYDRRQARRAAYDEKYGMCSHGTCKADECPGNEED